MGVRSGHARLAAAGTIADSRHLSLETIASTIINSSYTSTSDGRPVLADGEVVMCGGMTLRNAPCGRWE